MSYITSFYVQFKILIRYCFRINSYKKFFSFWFKKFKFKICSFWRINLSFKNAALIISNYVIFTYSFVFAKNIILCCKCINKKVIVYLGNYDFFIFSVGYIKTSHIAPIVFITWKINPIVIITYNWNIRIIRIYKFHKVKFILIIKYRVIKVFRTI